MLVSRFETPTHLYNVVLYTLTLTDCLFPGSSLKNSFNTLNAAAAKLKAITNSKFDTAVNSGDVASVERFFKLFPLLGIKEEGLTKFAKWQSAQVGDIYLKIVFCCKYL